MTQHNVLVPCEGYRIAKIAKETDLFKGSSNPPSMPVGNSQKDGPWPKLTDLLRTTSVRELTIRMGADANAKGSR